MFFEEEFEQLNYLNHHFAELFNFPNLVMDNVRRQQIKIKFEIMAEKKPLRKVENTYEYVDYALFVLGETIFNLSEGGMLPNFLGISPYNHSKCREESENARNRGNEHFKNKKIIEAIREYTYSIMCAPKDSIQLAHAYGNRSAALLRMKFYEESIEDIKRALACNDCPNKTKEKLLLRQKKALKLLDTQEPISFIPPIPKIECENPNLPGASSSIEVKFNEKYGRHLVATKDINFGDVLLIEKPYIQTTVLESKVHLFICSECLTSCMNPIPCSNCRGVAYCSITCRRKAFLDYHRYECVIRRFCIDDIDFLATRLTLKGLKEYESSDKNGGYKKCAELINEVSFNEAIKRRSLFQLSTVSVARVFYILKNYTDILSEFDIEDNENILKTLLLRDQCIVNANCDGVNSWSMIEHSFITFGSGIYPTYGLFNHACKENVFIYSFGSTLVSVAKETIKAGEQCFVNYGMDPTVIPTPIRQLSLKRMSIPCDCLACKQNWPRSDRINPPWDGVVKALVGTNVEILHNMDKERKNHLLENASFLSEMLERDANIPIFAYILTKKLYMWLFFECHPRFCNAKR